MLRECPNAQYKQHISASQPQVWRWHNKLARKVASTPLYLKINSLPLAHPCVQRDQGKLRQSSGHRLRVPVPFRFPKAWTEVSRRQFPFSGVSLQVMTVAAKTIYELEAERVLVASALLQYPSVPVFLEQLPKSWKVFVGSRLHLVSSHKACETHANHDLCQLYVFVMGRPPKHSSVYPIVALA